MRRQVLTWPGGAHAFGLGLGGLRAVQDATNAGPQEVMMRLHAGTWRVDDVLAVLREGLVCGAELPRSEASRLVAAMAEEHGAQTLVPLAQIVLGGELTGVPDDPVGEPAGEDRPPENGDSAGSTDLAP